MNRADLRLLPAATVLWALAVLGIRVGTAAAIAAAAVIVVGVLTVIMASGGPRAAHRLFAHLGLVVLAAALLFPALHRAETTTATLEDAAADELRVELLLTTGGDPSAPDHGPDWARQGVQAMARTEPGHAEVGRSRLEIPGSVPVLLRAGDDAVSALATTRDGDLLRVRGRIHSSGELLVLHVTDVDTIPRSGIAGVLHDVRHGLRAQARAATSHLPADEAALLRGMTSGDTTGLSASSEEIMRRAGISHLVAVSGANIVIVIGAVVAPLLLAGVARRPRIVAAAVAVLAYVWLVGDEPSVLRAATMAAPLLAARFAGVRGSPVAALGMTIGLWSVIDPVTSASVGFMLSALSTAAILITAPPLAAAITDLSSQRISRVPALVIAVPLVAQLACTPVLILLTPEISLWAVPVNMVVGPVVGPTTILGLIALVLAALSPPAAQLVNTVAAGGGHLVLAIARTADQLPGSRIAVPEGGLGVLAGIGAGLAVAVAVVARRSPIVPWVLAALLVVALAPTAGRLSPLRTGADWIVAACAVGQGDAMLLRSPSGPGERTVLVDTGPDPAALRGCLDRLRVDRIDLLILSHPHRDHTGGNAALTGGRRPAEQWICPLAEATEQALHTEQGTLRGPGPDPGQVGAAGQRTGQGNGSAVAVVTGQRWEAPGMEIEVLWPPSAEAARNASAREQGAGEGDAANDCSVSIAVQWADGLRLVSLGDLEPAAQRELAAMAPGAADIVKVAHHGSRFQHDQLYGQLAADLAIISVGNENSFGHPTDDALDMLRRAGSAVVRTDQHGTVILPAEDPRAPRSVGPGR